MTDTTATPSPDAEVFVRQGRFGQGFSKARAKWKSLDSGGKAITILCVAGFVLVVSIILMPTSKDTTAAEQTPSTISVANGNIDPIKQGQAIAEGVEKKFAMRYKTIEDSIAAMQTSQVKTDGRLQKLEAPVSDDYYTKLRDSIANYKK